MLVLVQPRMSSKGLCSQLTEHVLVLGPAGGMTCMVGLWPGGAGSTFMFIFSCRSDNQEEEDAGVHEGLPSEPGPVLLCPAGVDRCFAACAGLQILSLLI